MEGSERKWGWIALVVGALLLGYVLGDRSDSRSMGYGPQHFGPRAGFVAPQAPEAPAAPHGPRFEREFERGAQGYGFRDRGFGHGPGMFFLAPLFLLGGLLKLALFGLVIFLVLRFFRGGRGGPWGRGGPPWGGHWRDHGHGRPEGEPGKEQDRPASPGPEKPPYTGETTSL